MSDNSAADEKVFDVIVIGGGAAGLTAGFWLQQYNASQPQSPLAYTVIEAQDRLGGRVHTDPSRPDLDLGPAYFGPLQAYTMRLCQKLGVEGIVNELPLGLDHRTQFSYEPQIFKFQNQSFAVPHEAPPGTAASHHLVHDLKLLGGFALKKSGNPADDASNELTAKVGLLEAMTLAMRNHLQDPQESIYAGLDQLSVDDWIAANIDKNTPSVSDLLRVGVRSALSAEPSEVSMAYLLYYTATGGSFVNVMAVGGGADSYRFKHGAKSLPQALRKQIGDANIRPQTRVVRLEQRGDRVVVHTEQGQLLARRAIVAMSPTQFSPDLLAGLPGAAQKQELRTKMKMGRTIKAFLTFKNPWWRSIGSSGYALSAVGPVVWTMDNTWPSYSAPKHFSLMAFIVGAHADKLGLETPETRLNAIIEHWGHLFEIDSALIRRQLADRSAYHEGVWDSQAWSGGCPAAFFPPNNFIPGAPHLREPVGSVHFAGSETATDWVGGYLDGAIQSGIRAAEEVIKILSVPAAAPPA